MGTASKSTSEQRRDIKTRNNEYKMQAVTKAKGQIYLSLIAVKRDVDLSFLIK